MRIFLLVVTVMAVMIIPAMAQTLQLPPDYYTQPQANTPAVSPNAPSAIDEQSISGGIGEDDAMRMHQAIGDYNLKLVFTGEGGVYLADVNYVLRDKSGKVTAQGTSYGPILMLKVPAGTYQLEAEAEGYSKKQSIKAGSQGLQVYQLRYPIS